MPKRVNLSLVVLLGVVVAVSAFTRATIDRRLELDDGTGWVSVDPDGFFHMRRVWRLLEQGFPVATHDPFMNYPYGADIIWPPGYTLVAWGLLAPFAPVEPDARALFVERGVASLPFVWGVLTSLVVALAGTRLGGRRAGLVAGLLHALSFGSVSYSGLGIGDHHAFASLLAALAMLVLTDVLARGRLQRRAGAARAGALLGVLAGAMLASWVASLTYVLVLELVLAILLVRHARRPLDGLAAFGLAFHGVAALVILPVSIASPFSTSHPWSIVYISWFQPALLAAGALVFGPLPWLARRDAARRRYPWVAAATLVALTGALVLADAGPVPGIREGLSVVEGEDAFVSSIEESQPLLGAGAAPGAVWRSLGLAWPLLPLALAWAAWRAWRDERLEWLPFALLAAVSFAMAASQVRFADALAAPMAVMLGGAGVEVVARLAARGRLRAVPGRAVTAGLAVLAVGAQAPCVAEIARRLDDETRAIAAEHEARAANRRLYEWLREHTPEPADYAILANWARGHGIEWIARRPTVATNFGTYAGVEGFEAPARFLLAEDADAAEALLERRRARYVLVAAKLPFMVPNLAKVLEPESRSRWLAEGPRGTALQPAWRTTIGARLLLPARAGEAPIDFLRLVHATPEATRVPVGGPEGARVPFCRVFEHVRGARLAAEAAPGTPFEVVVEVDFARAGHRVEFVTSGVADAAGRVSLRVPYPTDAPSGDGAPRGPARWRLGTRAGVVTVPERAVLAGEVVPFG